MLAHKKKRRASAGSKAIFNSFSRDTPESRPIQAILKARPRFTAILTVSPTRAQLVVQAAKNAGLSIPRDLRIACFQGTDAQEPSISGPRIDFEALGRRAVQLLKNPHERGDGKKCSEGRTLGHCRKGPFEFGESSEGRAKNAQDFIRSELFSAP